MSDTFLTRDEVRELTGRIRRKTQASVLHWLGIEHKTRPDGTLIVLRAHVDHLFGADTKQTARARVYEIDRSLM